MSNEPFQIGPFEITEAADRGGMAEVWYGFHRAQRVPVALKVLTGPDASHPNFLAAFNNEIRAVTGLDHPNIIHVFDHGVIDEEVQRASGGRLSAGCPYLVMEWASGGNLAVGARPRNWKDLREALSALLDALGHAHARGVIHRDLKRQNVLMCGPGDLRPGWKLADFGMARPPDIEADPLAGGTPGLMSPEQADGRWRDQGPWTDLYALGCLAWVMVTGKRGQALLPPDELLTCPPTNTPIPVPAGMWGWIAWLTQAHPHDRPAFAAEAKAHLLSLGEPDPNESAIEDGDPDVDPETGVEPTYGNTRTLTLVAGSTSNRPRPGRNAPESRLPIPADWRDRHAQPAPLHLHGAGLSLFGLRPLPLVGREDERDALWRHLCGTATSGRPSCIILRGPAGTGKTRLARWLCWRAHEVGGAAWLHATHEGSHGPNDGIGPMIARYLRCAGMDREDLALRLNDLVTDGVIPDAVDSTALFELIAPGAADRLGSADRHHEGREAARRLITRHAVRHPRIVWLDDAQHDGRTLEFACRLLETPAPIFVVVCVRDEELASRPEIGARLVDLARHPEVRALDVAPLTGAAWRTMVREILGLDGTLAAQLEERAAGNPLFAVHLVAHWVAHGMLVPGEGGFRLAARGGLEVPEDLHEIWRTHLEAVLAGRPKEDGYALELAAVLGQDVVVAEWADACRTAGLPVPIGLVEALSARRLARSGGMESEGRWTFVHAMVRESLTRRAREAGRLADHNRACAAMLATKGRHPAIEERRGRHLLLAGDLEAALEPLLWSARARLAAGERDPAAAIVGDCVRAMEQLGLPADHRLRAGVALVRAELASQRGDITEESRYAGEAALLARGRGWAALEARALLRVGVSARERADLLQATAAFSAGARVAEEANEQALFAACLAETGRVHVMQGNHLGGMAELEEAERRFRSLNDTAGVTACLLGIAKAARAAGALPRASASARTALGYVELLGWKRLLGEVLVELGDVARAMGDLSTADGWYRTALDRARTSGADALTARIGLAFSMVDRGKCGIALPDLQTALEEVQQRGHLRLIPRLRMAIAVCAAKAGEWALYDLSLDLAAEALHRTGLQDPEVAWLAQRASALALGAGQAGRAATAGHLTRARSTVDETAELV